MHVLLLAALNEGYIMGHNFLCTAKMALSLCLCKHVCAYACVYVCMHIYISSSVLDLPQQSHIQCTFKSSDLITNTD